MTTDQFDQLIWDTVRKHSLAVEGLTEAQFVSALKQAIQCGDFVRHVVAGADGTQQVVYLPHAKEQEHKADTQRMDWLERNLMRISHGRATCSVDMGGRCVRGQLVNEARGANGGSSYFRVNHRSIREAIDAAIRWPNDSSSPATVGGKEQ